MFTPTTSSTGALDVRWRPEPAAVSLEAWILLVDPEGVDPDALDREAFLRELIRVPLDPRAATTTLRVPIGRAIGVALVARDGAGRALEPLEPQLTSPPSSSPTTGSPPPDRPPLATPRGDALQALERAVADRLAVPAQRALGPTGFGVRQRRTLSRLAFPVAGPAPRVAIVRSTFIHDDDVRGWAAAPPEDAIPLPPDADGIIDAATADEAMAFYVVLEGPVPWRPLVLSPVPPPFDAVRRPHVIGDGHARAAELLVGAPPSGPARELVDAALAALTRREPA